ncbi:hypothetical protein DFS34DRAFT_445815 [Phlyctochytrium arcticum]|nr:hypothetical protein DFS34DRAFT_445815 [Phlyctochytrium arcticum]
MRVDAYLAQYGKTRTDVARIGLVVLQFFMNENVFVVKFVDSDFVDLITSEDDTDIITRTGKTYMDINPEYASLGQRFDNDSTTPLPMIVPPLPWGPSKSGGYLSNTNIHEPLVHVSYPNLHTVAVTDDVYSVVNRLQSTPLRILKLCYSGSTCY